MSPRFESRYQSEELTLPPPDPVLEVFAPEPMAFGAVVSPEEQAAAEAAEAARMAELDRRSALREARAQAREDPFWPAPKPPGAPASKELVEEARRAQGTFEIPRPAQIGAWQSQHDRSKGVYAAKHRDRSMYEVRMGATMMRREGEGPFDTGEIRARFQARRTAAMPNALGERRVGLTHPHLDSTSGPSFETPEDWKARALMWVCVEREHRGVFYSHVSKYDRFHHTTFTAGGDVVAAGEWIVEKGKLRKISGNSGHYKPSLAQLHRAVLLMAESLHADTTVFLYDAREQRYVDYPVASFIAAPSGNGQLHPHASAVG